MVLCGLGMQQYTMLNATIQKKIFYELGVYIYTYMYTYMYTYIHTYIHAYKATGDKKS